MPVEKAENLPASIESERAVLGSILLNNSLYRPLAAVLPPDDYSSDSHRIVVRRIGMMVESGIAIDLVTLAEEPQRNLELENVGGATFLPQLTARMPRLANLDHYIEIIGKHSARRSLVKIGEIVGSHSMGLDEPKEIAEQAARRRVATPADTGRMRRMVRRSMAGCGYSALLAVPATSQAAQKPPRLPNAATNGWREAYSNQMGRAGRNLWGDSFFDCAPVT